MTPHSLEQLRVSNRRAITGMLGGMGPMSRADLARRTGLSRSTVSTLVAELIDSGHVQETTERARPHRGGSGRPPILVALAIRPGHVAGIDIGRRHMRIAVSDRGSTMLARRDAPIAADAAGRDTLDDAADLLREACADAGVEVSSLLQVGMCVPGPIDQRSERINAHFLPGWADLAPARELQERLDAPVVADNDANLGAMAEHQYGAGRGAANLIFVKVASGVGAGVVIDGRLRRGATGNAGELGHVQVRKVDADSERCSCGRIGCLESVAATPALRRALRSTHGAISLEQMLTREKAGDDQVRRVLAEGGRTTGRALADLCTFLNPEAIVIGGSLVGATSFIGGVTDAVAEFAQPAAAAACRVTAGELGREAEMLGALALAITTAAAAE